MIFCCFEWEKIIFIKYELHKVALLPALLVNYHAPKILLKFESESLNRESQPFYQFPAPKTLPYFDSIIFRATFNEPRFLSSCFIHRRKPLFVHQKIFRAASEKHRQIGPLPKFALIFCKVKFHSQKLTNKTNGPQGGASIMNYKCVYKQATDHQNQHQQFLGVNF